MAMISKSIVDKIQYRIEQEELSSRLYKSMSIWLNINGFIGASKLWLKYSIEEMEHAQWGYDYLLALNIAPQVSSISEPKQNFNSLPNIIALSFKHETQITEQCKEFANECVKESDYMTLTLAQKYLSEQVEEINKLTELVDKLDAFGTSKEALQIFDIELGKMV